MKTEEMQKENEDKQRRKINFMTSLKQMAIGQLQRTCDKYLYPGKSNVDIDNIVKDCEAFICAYQTLIEGEEKIAAGDITVDIMSNPSRRISSPCLKEGEGK